MKNKFKKTIKYIITVGVNTMGRYITNSLAEDKNNVSDVIADFSSRYKVNISEDSNINLFKGFVFDEILLYRFFNIQYDFIHHL